ncbi:hypothetical protein DFH06DRAFT_1183916 [Mycena polygramma]|nr:hypothetical protein DFH06DRAFT_1183916 [Mycena polygramma]
MGQRHQVFVVARVAARGTSDPRYRCVGAYHHQWCYGRLPLKAARRFITLIKQKDNAELVREELRSIQGKYGLGETEPRMPSVPCPYTTFLLASAWCVDLEAPVYGSGVSFQNSVLDAKMGSTEGDNNDGITVVDVTDPTHPSYCFVSIFGLESESSVPSRVPLSAEQYCRSYYPIPNDEQKKREGATEVEADVQEKIDSLRAEPLMKLDVLVEAWPGEYAHKPATENTSETASLVSPPIPSLADLSLEPAVKHGVEIGETEELEGLVWHPGKATQMKSILRGQTPFPDSGLSLLAKVVQHEAESDETFDLSSFSLSASQIVSLLTTSSLEKIQVLKLSHNPNVTVDVLRQILSLNMPLRRLVLLDTAISDEGLYELLAQERKLFHTVEELIHPALMSCQDPARYPNGFAYVGLHSHQTACSASLAVFTPATVVQSLTDFLSCIANGDHYDNYGLLGSTLVPQTAFASGVRGEGQPWGERRVHCFPTATSTPFDGKGWAFVARWGESMFDNKGGQYGFVFAQGVGTPKPTAKICGLEAFLEEMALEGRPAASEEAVKKLKQIFADLDSKKGAKLWTEEELSAFLKTYAMHYARRY